MAEQPIMETLAAGVWRVDKRVIAHRATKAAIGVWILGIVAILIAFVLGGVGAIGRKALIDGHEYIYVTLPMVGEAKMSDVMMAWIGTPLMAIVILMALVVSLTFLQSAIWGEA